MPIFWELDDPFQAQSQRIRGDLSIIETIADWVCVSGRYFLFIGRTDANFLDHLAPLEVREEGKQVNLVC